MTEAMEGGERLRIVIGDEPGEIDLQVGAARALPGWPHDSEALARHEEAVAKPRGRQCLLHPPRGNGLSAAGVGIVRPPATPDEREWPFAPSLHIGRRVETVDAVAVGTQMEAEHIAEQRTDEPLAASWRVDGPPLGPFVDPREAPVCGVDLAVGLAPPLALHG